MIHRGRFRRAGISAVGAGATAALGLTVIVAWYTGFGGLTSLGAHRPPMAPSEAELFLLFGGLLFFRETRKKRTSGHRVARSLMALGTAAAALLLVTSSLGITSSLEHLGLDPHGHIGGAPVGHMSPLTAGTFLLVGLSLFATCPVGPSRPRRDRLGFLTALGVVLIGAILLVAYALGGPIFFDTGVIPPALTTAAAFFVLGIALVGTAAEGLQEASGTPFFRSRSAAALFALAASVCVLIIVTGASGFIGRRLLDGLKEH